MAYQSNLLGDIYRRQSQRRALTGLPSSYQETRGLYDAALDYDARKAADAARLEEQRSQFNASLDLQKRAQKGQELASVVGGVGQFAQLPIAYGAAKNMGLLPKGFQLTSPSTWGGGSAPNLLGATGATGAVTTAQGAVAPVAAVPAQSAAFTGATGTAGFGAAEGSGAAGVLGAESGGLLSTVAPYAGPVGAGLLGGSLLGPTLDKILPGGGRAGKAVGGAAGGAMAGAAMGSVVPGVGTLVGGLIGGALGALGSLF